MTAVQRHTEGVRFLLKPGWIALTVVVLGFTFACYYLLAPWQFHRSTERDGQNLALQNALENAPIPRTALVPAGRGPAPDVEWRQVTVSGTYLPTDEVLVRLRSVDSSPAYEVMTPLRTPSGETLLVDRGYVRPESQGAVPPVAVAPPGTVTVTGYLRSDETGSARATIDQGGYRQVYAADAGLVSAATGVALTPGYVQLVADQPGVLTPVSLPQPDPNSSYSYAWQWLIFGVMAVGAWAYFVRLEYRTGQGKRGIRDVRERRADDPRDLPAGADDDPPDEPVPAGRATSAADAAVPLRTTEQKLADRYGRR